MSVSTKEYVIVGYDMQDAVKKMGIDELDDWMEHMEEELPERGHTLLYDGMSGNYCFVGYVINKSVEGTGLPVQQHTIAELQTLVEKVSNDLKDLVGEEQYPSLYTFTHWT